VLVRFERRDLRVSPLVYYATVTGTKDELGLGRVQVKLKGFPTPVDVKDVWIRMLQPAASAQTGFMFLPEVDDEVVVLRGAGDSIEGMLILGSVYGKKNKPIYSNADGDNITKEIRTKAGNAVTFTDKADEEAIVITSAKSTITVTISNKDKGLVSIKGADAVSIEAASKLTITSKEVTITGSDKLALGSDTAVNVTGGDLKLDGKGVTVSGSGDVVISGSSVNLG
jgi:uncharacterized protein involved in type VI secretion and phage assembly